LIAKQYVKLKESKVVVKITTDTFDLANNGYNSWKIEIQDTNLYRVSISVSDADKTIHTPTNIGYLTNTRTENYTIPLKEIDTSFICINGHAKKEIGKKPFDAFSRNIVFIGVKDSNFLFNKVVEIDSLENFKLDSLIFFDNIFLQFQINKLGWDDGSTKNIKLILDNKFKYPKFDTVNLGWENDIQLINKVDTIYNKQEFNKYQISKIKTLQTVIVKKYKSPRAELDKLYTNGFFSEPSMYAFDLRTDSNEYNRNLQSYLNGKAGIILNPITGLLESQTGHPLRFYI